ncbi:MAG: Ldh family oxidoreductase [Planctomycetaceae bacterium]|nr:Ldh family oxidoreductase [Planctomycetaceae bacterium]MBT4725093.1 Ldh family oxidoreductase [Planctomycetaceae bacterium]MBT4844388.1 Ldh family oxidoreductase [Planctomycetaceae bacterium]MBT5124055.1 Ldh family oxidoreductase [Planctomycetaceae bacterium]MBT5597596.1 Ldh family oxidoreductase [Planctomycetaceae bacterium]
MPSISIEHLQDFATQLLAAGGASVAEAAVVGPSLVQSDLFGYASHGVMRIPFYLQMLKDGDIRSEVELETIADSPAGLATDAHWGFGRVQCGRLLNELTKRCAQNGSAIGTVRNCSHIGRLGEYCEIAANDYGLVTIAMVNTHGAARRVAPPGGIRPRLGTNPLAMGVPNGDEALVLDFSTSATAEGKVRVKQIAGEQVPSGWLLDATGQPTQDPNTLYGDPPGTILPMGGDQAYKGFGLSLMIDIFSGAISGGLCARETPITPKGNCVFMMLIDPNRFGGTELFTREVSELTGFVRSCPRRSGVERILLPGDPERLIANERSESGIPLDTANWEKLTDLAEALDVDIPEPISSN